jgi:streptogramin lyase
VDFDEFENRERILLRIVEKESDMRAVATNEHPRTRWRAILVFVLLPILAMACSDSCNDNEWNDAGGDGDSDTDSDGDGDTDSDGDPTGCVDLDGDGYGTNCEAGADCDDSDPTRYANCVMVEIGDGTDNPWDPTDDNSRGVIVDEDGALTLDAYPEIEPAVWIANATEGTVTRLDARTGNEIARYPAAIPGGNSARPWSEACNYSSQGNCPSRTAIDFRGDCWVANRAFGNQGSVTKIASHMEDCVDRNGDGVIQTSRDLDGNGRISLRGEEFLGENDECVLFTVDVGNFNGVPRALAIAPDMTGTASGGNAWVGMNLERRFAEIDGDSGAIRRYVEVPVNPYGALASKFEGKVWVTNAGWQSAPDNPPGICAIDFRTGEVSPRYDVESTSRCVGTYGITVDESSRVWVGGYPCDGHAFRYDPMSGRWMTVVVPDSGLPRGLVADGIGHIWLAHCSCGGTECGLVTRFNQSDGGDIQRYRLPSGRDTIGVDLDAEGRIWTVSRTSNNAARIDPMTGEVIEVATGEGPYTYSDFTGHSLLLQFPRGYYRDVLDACLSAHWLNLRWDGDTPGATSIEIRVRTAATQVGLASAEWYGPFVTSPVDLQAPPGPVPDGQFMEIEITLLTSDDTAVPTLRSLELTYECPVG